MIALLNTVTIYSDIYSDIMAIMCYYFLGGNDI